MPLLSVYLVVGFLVFIHYLFLIDIDCPPKLAFAYAIYWPIFFIRYMVKAALFAITNNYRWIE